MRNPRTIARYAAALAVAALLAPGTGQQSIIAGLLTVDNPICYEDGIDSNGHACVWDCATMGNGQCGPVITPAGIETDTGENVAGYN
jgi:hypothetical protein